MRPSFVVFGFLTLIFTSLLPDVGGDRVEDLLLFRNIFYSYGKMLTNLSEDDLANYILLPTESLINSMDETDMGLIQDTFMKFKRSDLYNEGVEKGFEYIPNVRQPLYDQNLPLTFIVFPGMFGEFLPTLPFSDCYDNSSKFHQQWLNEFEKTTLPKEDLVFDLYELDNISLPLTSLFDVSSLDDADGTPFLQLIGIRPHPGSLESLGSVDSVAEIYNRRIEKILNIMDEYIDHIYLIGYSRTAADIADVIVHARENGDWWSPDVRGIITIAGVNFGTPVADCIIGDQQSDPPALCDEFDIEIHEIKALSDMLVPDIRSIIPNTILWEEALAILVTSEFNKPDIPEMDQLELIWPSLYQTWQQLLKGLLFDEFDLRHPVKDYAGNVIRFQMVVDSLYDCILSLTTAGRAAWWNSHSVPADIKYFFLSDTQQDPDVNVGPEVHTDTYMLREQYYQLRMMGGGDLNDAQVPSSRAMFLPKLHSHWNPNQEEYTATWLGITSSTHWGITLPVVFPCPDGWKDPFPRLTLLQSIATFVAKQTPP